MTPEEITQEIQQIKEEYIRLIQQRFEGCAPYQKLHIANALYPYENQPPISDFPMLAVAGINTWGMVCDHDGLVKWLDIHNYIEFLYLKYSEDFTITPKTLTEFSEAVFNRGTSGFNGHWSQRS